MDPVVQPFLRRLEGLPGAGVEIAGGIQQAISIAERDPEMALTRLRKVLEYVLRDVFVRHCGEDPGTRPLENVQQRLLKEGHLPDRLSAYANTIRMLGNVGTHKFNQNVTHRDVDQSLLQLIPIIEWYLPELSDAAPLDSTSPAIAASSDPPALSTEYSVQAPPASHLPTIGGFELISILGEGAQSVVYRAKQLVLDREVALKCLRSVGDRMAEQRFLRQIKALGQVDHPHIERVHAWGTEGDHWYFATELLPGSSLACIWEKVSRSAGAASTAVDWPAAVATACAETLRQEKPLHNPATAAQPPQVEREKPSPVSLASGRCNTSKEYVRDVVEIIRQVATATQKLHEAGIIHRDIKPANIMVSPDGKKAVLMDLGVARVSSAAVAEMTGFRHFVGTLPYSSPEQSFSADSADARSDVYSLGATLWELLTLRPLLGAQTGISERELIRRIQFAAPDPIRRYNKAVSRDLQAVVLKCLEKDPEQRYQTAETLAEELTISFSGRRGRIRRSITVTALAAIAGMVALGTYQSFKHGDTSVTQSVSPNESTPKDAKQSEGQTVPMVADPLPPVREIPASVTQADVLQIGLQDLLEEFGMTYVSVPGTQYSIGIVEVDDIQRVSVPIYVSNGVMTLRLRPGKSFAVHVHNGSEKMIGADVKVGVADEEGRFEIQKLLPARSVCSIPGFQLRGGPEQAVRPVGVINLDFKQPVRSPAHMHPPSLHELREVCERLATEVSRILSSDEAAGEQVTIRPFRGPNNRSNAEITSQLRQSLEAKGFHVVFGFAYEVSGRVVFSETSSEELKITLVAEIHGKAGEPKHSTSVALSYKQERPWSLDSTVASAALLYDVSDIPILPVSEFASALATNVHP